MRKHLIAAAASVGLLTGAAAHAQETAPTPPPAGQSEYIAGQPRAAGAAPSLADPSMAENMLGRTVVGADGEKIGEVEDIVLDANTGAVERLVIASGGFLGMGAKTIAVHYAEASLEPGADEVKLASLTAASASELPEFEYDDATISLGRGNVDQVGGTPLTSPAE